MNENKLEESDWICETCKYKNKMPEFRCKSNLKRMLSYE